MASEEQQQAAREIEARVGNPRELWIALKERVQADALKQFSEIQNEWLHLMWAMDAFRSKGVLPLNAEEKTIGAFNRKKGDRFAELSALLLQNRTNQRVGSRVGIEGFSQDHQIDVAWPARRVDPLICAETKVTGAPATPSDPIRGALSDFSNRRKELKFAATDLKLFRRQQDTAIEHWGVWRTTAPPKTFFLWGARLRTRQARNNENIGKLVQEARVLASTYLDGAGIIAWQVTEANDAYEVVELPALARDLRLDDTLYRIASEINLLAGPEGEPPAPEVPDSKAVPSEELPADSDSEG